MQTATDEAPQGLPEGAIASDGQTAPQPATEDAPDTGTEQAQQIDGQDQPQETAENKTEEEPAPEKPKQTPWFQRRIDDLTREKWEARREAETLRQQLVARSQEQTPEGETPAPRHVSPADIDRLATERAEQIAAQKDFDRRCNETYEKGNKEFPDFADALANFRLLGGLPPTLIEAAEEAGNAHSVLYQLGKNPDEAARILSLPPVRMAAAVAKLANSPAPAPRPISSAPPPIRPIAGSSKVEADPERMSMDEWVRKHPLPSRR